MEPILQNPHFTKLLRVWQFVTAYHQYLGLTEKFSELSLYELSKHIEHEKFMTSMISQIIEALTKKATGQQKVNKYSTILFLAKNCKFNFFEDLIKTSYYQLALSHINYSLSWRDLPEIQSSVPFQSLKTNDKYRFLTTLINLVSTSPNFKNQYLEEVRKEYGEAHNKSGNDKKFLHTKYTVKLGPSLFLGKDHTNNLYFYFSKIHDCIFSFNTAKNQWKLISGQENVKKEIVEKLLQKPKLLNQYSLDLLQSIQLLWSKLNFTLEYKAFNKTKELFSLKVSDKVGDKLGIIKQKFYQLDETYSRFVGDCYNFRWAPKQVRRAFVNQVKEAKEMKDIVGCLGTFFHKTKHTIQKKINNTIDSYDCNLNTADQPDSEFKNMFLRMNYLYVKDVFKENLNSKSFSVNMYHHIKSFLQLSQTLQPYLYAYLTTFVECMLGIIKQMYPGALERRAKLVQKMKKEQLQKQKQQKVQNQGKNTRNRLKKNTQPVSQVQSSSQNEQEESSVTNDKNQTSVLNGRRLRNKVRIDYKIVQSTNSKSKQNEKKISKPSKPKLRIQPKRNQKGKQSKMTLDSDSDLSEDGVDLSLSNSDTEKQDQGLSLDKYKYIQEDDTQKFRRQLRSSKGK